LLLSRMAGIEIDPLARTTLPKPRNALDGVPEPPQGTAF
jgi:hypothetical protein